VIEGVDVVGPAVLVVGIIGVFPGVEPQNRGAPFRDRAVLIGGGFGGQLFSLCLPQPPPPPARKAPPRLWERLPLAVPSGPRPPWWRRRSRRWARRRPRGT